MLGYSYIQASNLEALRRSRAEVNLRTNRFANALLSGTFRAMLRIERSFEFSEPEVFQLDDDPDRILWSRLSPHWFGSLPFAIAAEVLLAAKYQLFSEYDFVFVADVSQSMMLDWWHLYGGALAASDTVRNVPGHRVPGDRTKLFFLKYILLSFLRAAQDGEFTSFVYLFGGGKIQIHSSVGESHFEEAMLHAIDDHFFHLARNEGTEESFLPVVLRQLAIRRRRSIVVCVTDFLDTLRRPREKSPSAPLGSLLNSFAEIMERHRLVILQLNDLGEIAPVVEEVTKGRKTCPIINSEKEPLNKDITLQKEDVRSYAVEVFQWMGDVRRALSSTGIPAEQLVAGHNDWEIDKKLIRLGISTSI